MDLKIKGKIALVTGAGRGLGHGICKSLSNEGAIIIILAIAMHLLVAAAAIRYLFFSKI
mgnify:CR=1 FL=1